MPDKQKILVCGVLPPPNFGHSMMYKMLMASDFVQAHEVIFLELKFWSYAKHKQVTVDKILKMVKYWFSFAGILFRERPRYVLFNMSFDRMPFLKDYLFCVTAAALGSRVVLHDFGQYLPDLYNSSGPLYKKLVRHLLKVTFAIIVMGAKVREAYTPFFERQRLVVVPGCVEDTHGLAAERLSKTEGTIDVLYFSFISVSKGIWTALNAVPLAVQKNPRLHFTFAGPMESPELKHKIDAYIEAHGLRPHVTVLGYVEGVAPRTALFRQADIFIFPTHRDVFGLVLLHAMAEQIPVIASIEGAIPEIIEDDVQGFLFPKSDHQILAQTIVRLAGDPLLRRRLGEAGRRKYLQSYSPEVYGRRMIEVFQALA